MKAAQVSSFDQSHALGQGIQKEDAVNTAQLVSLLLKIKLSMQGTEEKTVLRVSNKV